MPDPTEGMPESTEDELQSDLVFDFEGTLAQAKELQASALERMGLDPEFLKSCRDFIVDIHPDHIFISGKINGQEVALSAETQLDIENLALLDPSAKVTVLKFGRPVQTEQETADLLPRIIAAGCVTGIKDEVKAQLAWNRNQRIYGDRVTAKAKRDAQGKS